MRFEAICLAVALAFQQLSSHVQGEKFSTRLEGKAGHEQWGTQRMSAA